mmetsp:Transcript_93414/g.185346  ORF Transcript_93414/g.185346 Transcript_93414/m.185346 type:complete len:210 (+) Transcript_93414:2493-3122(+)
MSNDTNLVSQRWSRTAQHHATSGATAPLHSPQSSASWIFLSCSSSRLSNAINCVYCASVTFSRRNLTSCSVKSLITDCKPRSGLPLGPGTPSSVEMACRVKLAVGLLKLACLSLAWSPASTASAIRVATSRRCPVAVSTKALALMGSMDLGGSTVMVAPNAVVTCAKALASLLRSSSRSFFAKRGRWIRMVRLPDLGWLGNRGPPIAPE